MRAVFTLLMALLIFQASPVQALVVVDLTKIEMPAKKEVRSDERTNAERLVDLARKKFLKRLAKAKKKLKMEGATSTPPFNFSSAGIQLDSVVLSTTWSF